MINVSVYVVGAVDTGKTTIIGQLVKAGGIPWSSTDGVGALVVLRVKWEHLYTCRTELICGISS